MTTRVSVADSATALISRKRSFARVARWIRIGAVDAIYATLLQPFHSAVKID
jgi:hypothetical protein